MIRVTIDGIEVELEKPVTILEAAGQAGITIPTLCYFEGLPPFGGCRLCVVEVEKLPKLQTSCTLRVADGMVVRTETEQIKAARRAMLEFLLINHPLDCPVCDKAGECTLQDLVARYGPAEGRFIEGKRKHPESFDDPIIVRNMERCVLCTRCVRMCDELQGAYAITVTGRGGHSFVEPFSGGRYNCEYCGNCLTVCPVGAIMSRLHRHTYRAWFIEREVETLCGYCGVGCSMVLQMRGDDLVRTIPRMGLGLNNGLLCVRGRFGYDSVDSDERLSSPLLRVDGGLKPVTWEEALSFIATRLSSIKEAHGAKAIGAIASGRCTNEDNYMLQRFIRFTIGSNNIDSLARLYYAPAVSYLEKVFGQGITANLIPGIANSDGIFVAGGDPASVNPVLGLQIRASWRSGGKVITLGDPGGLKRFVNYRLIPTPFTEEIVLLALVGSLMKRKGLSGENGALEERLKELRAPKEEVLSRTGVSSVDLERLSEDLSRMTTPVVVIGPDIVQTGRPSKNLFLLGAMAYLINARIFLLSERPNYQGLMDIGCLPDMLPGGRPLGFEMFRHKVEDVTGFKVPAEKGLNLFEMLGAAEAGGLKALYVMGENPLYNLPDRARTERAFGNLDLLIVQDIYLTETGMAADVVLPASSWTEKDGTFTNLERRVQMLRSGRLSSKGRDDWRIIADIANRLGTDKTFSSAEDVWEDMTNISPLHTGLTYEDIRSSKGIWPYHGEPLRGGEGDFEVEGIDDSGILRPEGEIYLMPERLLYHSGTMSRRSKALLSVYPGPSIVLSPGLAERYGVSEGDEVRVTTDRGSIVLKVKLGRDLPGGLVLLSNTFEGAGIAGITGYSIDPVTGAMLIHDNRARIDKVAK